MKKLACIFVLLFSLVSVTKVSAQCAMCRRVAESSHQVADNKAGAGLNAGIIYLLVLPYILAGVGAIVWYKNRNK